MRHEAHDYALSGRRATAKVVHVPCSSDNACGRRMLLTAYDRHGRPASEGTQWCVPVPLQVGEKPAILRGSGCAFVYQMLLSLFRCLCQRQPCSSVSAPVAAVFYEAFVNGTIWRLFAEKLKSPKTVMSALCSATDGGNSDAGTACVGRSRSAPLAAGFSVCAMFAVASCLVWQITVQWSLV